MSPFNQPKDMVAYGDMKVMLNSFPVDFIEEPVGECDDGVHEIFVRT